MKRLLHFSFLALTVLLAAGTQARASHIDWTYQWSNTAAVFSDNGAGSITLSNEGTPTAVNATDSNPVVATNLKVISSADADHLEYLDKNGAISMQLTIVDKASGLSHTFTFTGKLGAFTASDIALHKGDFFSAGSANVKFTITGAWKQSFSFKESNGTSNTYTVYYNGSYTPPGPTEAGNKGAIGFQVDVGNAKITTNTPEPTAMLLSVLGASFAGFSSWRLRRRRAALAA